jgi:hypothetical protein
VELAVIDDHLEVDVRELGQERLLGGVLLVLGVAAGVHDQLAALPAGVGVQLGERLALLRHGPAGVGRRGAAGDRCAQRSRTENRGSRTERLPPAECGHEDRPP